MGENSRLFEFEYFLLRYVPNVLTGEFVNIGLVIWGANGEDEKLVNTRFRQDWSRVLQFDPDADIEVLATACAQISDLLQQAFDQKLARHKLESTLSNVIQISECWTIRADNVALEMDRLAAIYLASSQPFIQRNPPKTFQQIPVFTERKSLSLPLWGMVAAGRPIEAVQTAETISLEDVVGSKNAFVLKVRGDSMQDEHIVDGDYVLLEKTKQARNGDIVVALVDGYDATLKRFYHQGETIRLQPSNVTMPPIIVASASVQIQGKVIGVLRKYL